MNKNTNFVAIDSVFAEIWAETFPEMGDFLGHFFVPMGQIQGLMTLKLTGQWKQNFDQIYEYLVGASISA